jgi:undecaprenol kinase
MGKLVTSFKHALHGVLYIFEHERNARVHLLLAVFAFVLGVWLRVSDVQLAAIFFAIILVFLAEIFNTAIEKTLDLIDVKIHPQIKLIKDMSAGAVLVAAIAAAAIGTVVFVPQMVRLWLS